ncbi:MAG: alpha-N-acetylglucosaminidase [Coriobacteriaceae bacterium]|nr:alpha-N-acetylglucosaminidase [Coriobacteriaceae bacterium]
MMLAALVPIPAWAADPPISGMTARGASASGHPASAAIDGDASTWWESPGVKSMQDYRRFIDLDLHGLYRLESISITNLPGSSYRYEVYASEDGEAYSKIAYKADRSEADAADVHQLKGERARHLRIQVSHNSAGQVVNLAEVSVNGTKISDEPAPAPSIDVKDFKDTSWGEEWERVATDPSYAEKKTIRELHALVDRVLGEGYRDAFTFELRQPVDGKDVFELSDADGGGVLIRGNDGVSLASGLNYYLRHWCHVDYNPLFGSNLSMPNELPRVGDKVLKFTNYEYRYALNFCTYSYTMAFWNWGDYEPFLDWAAMNGVNLMLDIVGQEEVLRQTLNQFGYSDDEVKEYITGPGYYAWFYMQNMYGAGGPLPNAWFEQRTELGRRIHDRMQAYGIDPVIQGFGGQVPVDFQKKNPDSIAASSGGWVGFARPHMIKTYLTDADRAAGKQDYFQKMGTAFYEVQDRLFGEVSHYYAVDPFHEGGTIPAGFNIVDIYRTVQQKMLDHDADAIWVMQQWQWGINENKLSGLAKKEQALVLDLQSDLRSQAGPMEKQGVPWVWNMLHNFGGRMGMDGVPEVLATKVTDAYNASSHMRGIGITPEAIDNSSIVYELLFDMTWEQDPVNYRSWTHDYIERRYGGTDEKIQQAWDILLDTAYRHEPGEYYQGASESIMNARPSDAPIGSASTWGHSDIDYDKRRFEQAAELFIECYDRYSGSEAFRYDFVDVMRQVLANSFQELQPQAGEAYRSGDLARFRALSEKMLAIIRVQDEVLSTSDRFLLGTWIEDARTMLDDADDWTRDLFEFNARALVTTWGMQKNGSLIDYSNRQWAGLTGEYYLGRWQSYADNRIAKLEEGKGFSDPDWFRYGWEWANRKSDEGFGFQTKASGADQRALARKIMDTLSVTAADSEGSAAGSSRVNLAAGKDVIDIDANVKVPRLTDGDTDSGWTDTGKGEATLEIDLDGPRAITGAGITLQQIAADFPLRYEIEVLDKERWVEIGRSEAETVSSKNEVEARIVGSKVRFRLHATDGADLTGIYELAVWGADTPPVEYENLALGATATARSSQRGRGPEAAIDGRESSLWVNNGSGQSWYQVTLAAPQRVDRARLVFESAGRQFQFKMVAGLPDGTERLLVDQTGNQGSLDRVYDARVDAEISYVRVDFTGSVPGSTPWPAIAELELLRPVADAVPLTNIAPAAAITSSPTKSAPEDTSALVDGTGTAWVSRGGAVPAWFQLDWGKASYVERIRLDFEATAPDRSMQFALKVTDTDGAERTVFERRAEDLSRPQGLSIDVPVGCEITRVRMDVADARVPSSGGHAWPLVAEVAVLATPKNVAPTANLRADEGAGLSTDAHALLTDGITDRGIDLSGEGDKSLVFELGRPVDIDAVLLAFASMSEAPRFMVEYREVAKAEVRARAAAGEEPWETMFDYRANDQVRSSVLLRTDRPVRTDALRITFANAGTVPLSEVAIYAADMTAPLSAQVAAVRSDLDRLTFGPYAGNYDEVARAALEEVLAGADALVAEGGDSRAVALKRAEVADAVRAFYRDGFVSIDRNALYVAIDDAEAIKAALDEQGHASASTALARSLDDAKRTASAYGTVTQEDVDAASASLAAAVEKALSLLDAVSRYQVALSAAEQSLEDAEVGDFEGQHPASFVDALRTAVAAAKTQFSQAAGNPAGIDAATAALREASAAFLGSKVRIDASALEAAVAQAGTLVESEFDRDAWRDMAEKLAAAESVDAAAISQADLDAVAAALSASIEDLMGARLDRGPLETAIASSLTLREGDYTERSWALFAKTLAAAVDARDASSTSQEELDQAAASVVSARQALARLDHDDDLGDEGHVQDGGTAGGGTRPGPGNEKPRPDGAAAEGSPVPGSEARRLPATGDPLALLALPAAVAGALLVVRGRRPRR